MRWNQTTLGAVLAEGDGLIQTGPFGSQLHQSDYVDDGVPVVMPKDIADGRVNEETVARVSDQTADRLARHQLAARTIVLPRRGEITKRAFVRDGQAGWLCGTGCVQIRTDATALHPEFLYYYMEQVPVVRWLEQHAVGTTMLNLNTRIVSELPIAFPKRSAQEKIAAILWFHDDLIENNRRRMALLQQVARQLYREWFVRLRFPGHEHTPIVDGVPQGWERRELARCATFLSGGTPSKARNEFWEGEIPWVSSGELTEMRISDTPLKITAEAADSGSRLVPRETILAVVRGMSLAKEWRISIASREVAFNQDLKAIVAKPGVDALFLFHSLETQRDQVRDRTGEASHGTKKLETAVLSSLRILVANSPMQRLFREHVAPMHDQWDNLHLQNQKLRAARDLLLPRLMSGEIAV